MIKKQVKEAARKRGITNAHGLQLALGISPTVAAKLWNDQFEMIGLSTLDKLCAFLDCDVCDLLSYAPPAPDLPAFTQTAKKPTKKLKS